MLRHTRGHSYFKTLIITKDAPVQTIRVHFKNHSSIFNHDIYIRGDYSATNNSGVLHYNAAKTNGYQQLMLINDTIKMKRLFLEINQELTNNLYFDYIIGFDQYDYSNYREIITVEIKDSYVYFDANKSIISHIEVLNSDQLINKQRQTPYNILEYDELANTMDLLGCIWISPKAYNGAGVSEPFLIRTLSKTNLRDYDYLYVYGSDTVNENDEKDYNYALSRIIYLKADIQSQAIIKIDDSITAPIYFGIENIDLNDSKTNVWGSINLDTANIRIYKQIYPKTNTLVDGNCGLVFFGVKKKVFVSK